MGTAWFMWLAPLFHHGPRSLKAERNARSSFSPAFIRFFARVIHHELAFGDVPLRRLDRLMGIPARPEAVARLGKLRLEYR